MGSRLRRPASGWDRRVPVRRQLPENWPPFGNAVGHAMVGAGFRTSVTNTSPTATSRRCWVFVGPSLTRLPITVRDPGDPKSSGYPVHIRPGGAHRAHSRRAPVTVGQELLRQPATGCGLQPRPGAAARRRNSVTYLTPLQCLATPPPAHSRFPMRHLPHARVPQLSKTWPARPDSISSTVGRLSATYISPLKSTAIP